MHFKWGADLVWWWSEIFPWKPGLLWWRRIRRVDNVGWGEKVPFFFTEWYKCATSNRNRTFIKIGAWKWNFWNIVRCAWEREKETQSATSLLQVPATVVFLRRWLLCSVLSWRRMVGEFMMTTSGLEHSHGSSVSSCFLSSVICGIFMSSSGGSEGGGGGLPFTLVLLLFLTVTL